VPNEYRLDWGAGRKHFDVFFRDLGTKIERGPELYTMFRLNSASFVIYSPLELREPDESE
jgi:hypothetical protein